MEITEKLIILFLLDRQSSVQIYFVLVHHLNVFGRQSRTERLREN